MSAHWAVRIFLAYALAYFLSALLRAVTATLAPVFSQELGLAAGDLGLLAGAYFLGFSVLQLPLGAALDRHGPRRVQLALMTLAVVGCAAFAMGTGLLSLFAARFLTGMGVAACLMAPLTTYRLRFSASAQLRANSWMLMTGSLGMLASTLPVQALLPSVGWRGLFWILAGCLLLAGAVLAFAVPPDRPVDRASSTSGMSPVSDRTASSSYRAVFAHPDFVRCVPLAFFLYGGMIAIQALWAGPWLTRVAGFSSAEAATGLFQINLCMLLAFLAWGLGMPRLQAWGYGAYRLMALALPLSLGLLLLVVVTPTPVGAWTWAAWCVSCTCISLSQPAIGQAFPPALAGRALSAYNLVIFVGIFTMQWGIGLAIDALEWAGFSTSQAFRGALGGFGLCCLLSYLWFLGCGSVRRQRIAG